MVFSHLKIEIKATETGNRVTGKGWQPQSHKKSLNSKKKTGKTKRNTGVTQAPHVVSYHVGLQILRLLRFVLFLVFVASKP